jgi:hypothetical protein
MTSLPINNMSGVVGEHSQSFSDGRSCGLSTKKGFRKIDLAAHDDHLPKMTTSQCSFVIKETTEEYLTSTILPHMKVSPSFNIEKTNRAHHSNSRIKSSKIWSVYASTEETGRAQAQSWQRIQIGELIKTFPARAFGLNFS